jgi:hypothetical protein
MIGLDEAVDDQLRGLVLADSVRQWHRIDRPTSAPRHAPARGDYDAERWLDEGGSFSGEAVATPSTQP